MYPCPHSRSLLGNLYMTVTLTPSGGCNLCFASCPGLLYL